MNGQMNSVADTTAFKEIYKCVIKKVVSWESRFVQGFMSVRGGLFVGKNSLAPPAI